MQASRLANCSFGRLLRRFSRPSLKRPYSSIMSLDRLRAAMRGGPSGCIDAVVVPSADAHQSEYVASCDDRRAFISGFTGSAGTAVVLQDSALLWTDGRYFLQAVNQLSPEWSLMRSGEPGVLSMEEWLAHHLQSAQRVGVDPHLLTGRAADDFSRKLSARGVELVPLNSNYVDDVWDSRPEQPKAAVRFHPTELAGESVDSKLARVRAKVGATGADAAVFSMLDEIMWLFNIRGNDIDYNPLAKSYAVVTAEGSAHLFIDIAKVPATEGPSPLKDVVLHPYEDVVSFLKELGRAGKRVALDSSQLSWKLCEVVKSSSGQPDMCVDSPSCIAMLKSLKNEIELKGVREAHLRDGVALTAFLEWIERTIKLGEKITECAAADKLEEFRQRMPRWVSPSFATISGYGANGAIIHYHATPGTCAEIGTDSTYLLDSGAQYLDGTTDVTRTVHFGTPSDRVKTCYTHVLKGHIALGNAIFPEGTTGSRLDALARLSLWSAGLDYNHGTGHGVGAFLNVHEGPQGIGFRPRSNEAGFYVGMTTSNEPGYYEDGSFGIRIENICITVAADTPNNFANRNFCRFETVTMCPIETDLIDFKLLNNDEVKWLNDYHAEVRKKLLPEMQITFPAAVDFLLRKTEPVSL